MIHNEIALKRLAIERYPEEACALIGEDGMPRELINVSQNAIDSFALHLPDLLSACLELNNQKVAIWHSHTHKHPLFDIRTPSVKDIRLHENTGCNLLISGFDGTQYFETVSFPSKEDPSMPLLNRPYIAGIYDCGTLVRDAYARLFNVSLTYKFEADYLHPKNWNLAIRTFLKANDFKEVCRPSIIQPGDLLVVDRQGLPASHGVMILDENLTVLDQQDKSRTVSIDSLETIRSIWRKL